MASLENQQTWMPYENTRDCSKGFCSLYCPQWCYIVFPPPPPLGFPEQDSGANFSPLVIAIIGILASAFLLVSYYTAVSKYCGNRDSQRGSSQHDPDEEFNDSHSPSPHEPWQGAHSGLDEALIKSITVCKYKKGDGLVEGTDCSVCLNEFQEHESLRLLPKCSHAFHLPCIDMWLKSHYNCPLCRAVIFSTTTPPQFPPPVSVSHPDNRSSTESRFESDTVIAVENSETSEDEHSLATRSVISKSDLDSSEERDTIIEIRDEEMRQIRRSFSMDSFQHRISIADVLMMSMEEDRWAINKQEHQFSADVGSSKHCGRDGKINSKSRVLNCVMSPTAMKRSSSSGRFLLTRQGRGRNTAAPISN